MSPVRILTFSTLYPDATRPRHGIFVETRLRELVASGEIEAKVVAPVPWFPSGSSRFGQWGAYGRVGLSERRHGIDVRHPRWLSLPKVGMGVAPWLLAAGAEPVLRSVREVGFDYVAIDAHYFYPDGVAAALLGKRLGIPVVITARGTDVTVFPDHAIPRRWILWAAQQSAAIVTVCRALKERLVALGVPDRKIQVLRNGVDLGHFAPVDRARTRARLGLARYTVLSVGNLVELKGHHLVIEAMKAIPDAELMIVGAGPERDRLELYARTMGVSDRVRLTGEVPQADLPDYYGAADVLVLASSREGWANVLLEAMACGTPCVATDRGGSGEVIADPAAGVLIQDRTAPAIAGAVHRLRHDAIDRAATRTWAERFSWRDTTQGQIDLLRRLL